MKTVEEIKDEITFQESEYDRIDKLTNGDALSDFRKDEYHRVMSRHAARRQALLWVIES